MRKQTLFGLAAVIVTFASTSAAAYAQVNPSSMVDPFTGKFQFSAPLVTVPGPAGSGITINLQYSSDVKPEQEASWVGFGWNLDVPMISRSKRGLPDDYYDSEVQAHHNVPDRIINVISPKGMPELFKFDQASGSANLSIIDDSELGMDVIVGAGLSAKFGKHLGASVQIREGAAPRFGLSAGFVYQDSSFQVGGSLNMSSLFNPRQTPGFMTPQLTSISMHTLSLQGSFKSGTNEYPKNEIGMNVWSTTIRTTDQSRKAFGFMYAPEAIANGNQDAILDYSTHRTSSEESGERPFAPFPVGEADLFHVSGSGVTGTFRVYHRLPFEVGPPKATIHSKVTNLHAEIMVMKPVLPDVGVSQTGFGFGTVLPPTSETSFTMGPIAQSVAEGSKSIVSTDKDLSADAPFVFRYLADPADELRMSQHDKPVYGDVQNGMDTRDFHELNRDRPIRSNTFIKPHFASELSPSEVFGEAMYSAALGGTYNRKMLVGFETISPSGIRYVFDRPVEVANEQVSTRVLRGEENLERAAPRVYHVPENRSGQDPVGAYQEYHDMQAKTMYAGAFLVTAITTPDYVDNGTPGPDNSDDGGWTKFTYANPVKQAVRSPYNGYWFDKGLLENPWDDKLVAMRSSSMNRFVRTIETPTHIAKFFTNKDDVLADRKDSWNAQTEDVAQTASASKTGANSSVYLTRIELHKKLDNGTTVLVSTTHLAYDYSLVPGNPSSSAGFGKLTLRKVWTEAFDVKDAYISPLELYYEYPTLAASGSTTSATVNVGRLATLYPRLASVAPTLNTTAQNPAYNPNTIDAWGMPGAVGVPAGIPIFSAASRTLPLPYDPTPQYQDPTQFAAPYTLKRLHTATGAEILVNYEPSEYLYVQDSTAMEFVPLAGGMPTAPDKTKWAQSVYSVSIAALTSPDEKARYIQELRRRFVTNAELLQCQFVYQMGMKRSGRSNINYALSNVKTYVRVYDVSPSTTDATILQFTVGTATPIAGGAATVKDMASQSRALPFHQALAAYREGCRRYYRAAKSGNILMDALSIAQLLVETEGPEGVDESVFVSDIRFPTLIPIASKLRLPSFHALQSSVPRVRSIVAISPDGMLQQNDASLVGSEFSYLEVGELGLRSSGVTTQEPSSLRDRMGIVQATPQLLRELADFPSLSRMDIERIEGPIGESLLPGASIGYARVVERSLFDGEANTGTIVRRYVTAREVPTIRSEWLSRKTQTESGPDILNVMMEYSSEKNVVQQGYSFHIRNCHGSPLSVEHYSGRASSNSSNGVSNGLSLLSATRWYYDDPESEMYLFDTLTRPLRMSRYGRDMELTSESKLLEIELANFQAQIALSVTNTTYYVFPFGPIPQPPLIIPSVAPSFQYLYKSLKSYVTTKLIRHPYRLRSIVTVKDGVRDSTEIVAYDARTGYPALTQRFDGYHGLLLDGAASKQVGSIISIGVPALRAYPEMGQRSESEGLVFSKPKASSPSLVDGGKWTGNVGLSVTGSVLKIQPLTPSLTIDLVKATTAYRQLFSIGDVIVLSNYDGTSKGTATVSSLTTTTTPASLQIGITGLSATPTSIDKVTIAQSARSNQIPHQASQYQVFGVDLKASRDCAVMLREREQTAEVLTDFARAPSSYVGMKWWRPLVRHYLYPRVTTFDETATMAAKLYPSTTSVCDPQYSPIELVVERSQTSPLPKTYAVTFKYMERVPNSFGVCTLTPIPDGADANGYKSVLPPIWTRWRRFYVSDRGDLVHSVFPDLANDTRQVPDLKFGFRDEVWAGGHPDSWDQAGVVKTPRPIADPLNTAQFLSAQGASFQRHALGSTGRGTYRPFESYVAKSNSLSVGAIAGVGQRVYNGSGTFTMNGLWNPLNTPSQPSPWQFAGAVRSYNKHGLPLETEDAAHVPTAIKYTRSEYLPRLIAQGASAQSLWGEDFEYIAPLPPDVIVIRRSRHTGYNGSDGSVSQTVGLPLLSSDNRLVGSTYTLRTWLSINDNCPLSSWTVTAGSTSLTGTNLAKTQVGFNDGYGLFEFDVEGPITTVSAVSTALRHMVDDIVIRPTESTVSQIVYDNFDRPLVTFDDQGWPSYQVYNDLGQPNRVIEESMRGKNMILDVSAQQFTRRRSTEEVKGGVHSTMGVAPMIGEDMFRAAFPQLSPFGFGNGAPSGVSLRQNLIQLDASPEQRSIQWLPETSTKPEKELK